MTAYSAGPCPICADFGSLSILKALESGLLFFHCEACGCAWNLVPKPVRVDCVNPVEKFAPKGHIEAPLEEIRAAGIDVIGKR